MNTTIYKINNVSKCPFEYEYVNMVNNYYKTLRWIFIRQLLDISIKEDKRCIRRLISVECV